MDLSKVQCQEIADRWMEMVDLYNSENMYEIEKYTTLNAIYLFPQTSVKRGKHDAADSLRNQAKSKVVDTAPMKGYVEDFIIVKPDMAIFTFKAYNALEGSVLNNDRGLEVWVKDKGIWKQYLNITNTLSNGSSDG